MKKAYLIFVSLALILLIGCSGEGYIGVINNTDGFIVFSLNDQPDETVMAGDTSNIYTISVAKGVVNNIPIEATGEYLLDYNSSISITDGNYVWHKINNQATYSYIKVENDTDSLITVTVEDFSSEVLDTNETSQVYSILTLLGSQEVVEITAFGYWVDFTEEYPLVLGDTTTITIEGNKAKINIVNTSVDSAVCDIEGNESLYFVGDDSTEVINVVDGSVEVSYYGRYMFFNAAALPWVGEESYRYEMIPNACEIQLNNLHPTWTIYYVYLSPSTSETWNDDDQLGDDVIESGYGYIWKADGDIGWDIQVQTGDPHPDSALYVYEYYDTGVCTSDLTWVYEFPTIFSEAQVSKIAKADADKLSKLKSNSLNKVYDMNMEPARIEKIKKVDAGKAGLKALRK